MLTLTVQIGNSDNKLTQQQWAWFQIQTAAAIEVFTQNNGGQIHFKGNSAPTEEWVNACFVFTVPDGVSTDALAAELTAIRDRNRQESIAWSEAPYTRFI